MPSSIEWGHLFLSIAATLLIMMAYRGQAFLQAPHAMHFDFMILGSTVNDFFYNRFQKRIQNAGILLFKGGGKLEVRYGNLRQRHPNHLGQLYDSTLVFIAPQDLQQNINSLQADNKIGK